METIEETLVTLLQTNTALISLIEDRIRPVELPLECPLPAIAYTLISESRHQVAGNPRIQYSVFSNSYPQAVLISRYLKETFEGYSGIINSQTVVRIYLENSYDANDSDAGVFQRVNDFKIVYLKQ